MPRVMRGGLLRHITLNVVYARRMPPGKELYMTRSSWPGIAMGFPSRMRPALGLGAAKRSLGAERYGNEMAAVRLRGCGAEGAARWKGPRGLAVMALCWGDVVG
jgi:hypothetical protein